MTDGELKSICQGLKSKMTYSQIAAYLKDEYGIVKSVDSVRNLITGRFYSVKPSVYNGIADKDVLEARGLNPDKWRVTNYRKDGLSVKPVEGMVTLADIDRYFADFDASKPLIQPLKMNYSSSGDTLLVELPDLHVGLLSWRDETGEDYDVKIAEKRLAGCSDDIVSRCKNRTFKKIILVTLGDLIHFDNADGKTTKGTKQDIDGRMPKVFDSVLNMLITLIDKLTGIAPVEVIYIPGNHDEIVGRMAVKAVELAYRDVPYVTFDCSPSPRKARLIGNTLIGFTHGNLPKNNMGNWLSEEFRKEYGKAKHAELHTGHLHTEKEKEFYRTDTKYGLVVRSLPTICSSSAWENSQAYSKGLKTLLSYVINDKVGLRDIWYSNV